jgi:DNA helicase-2/ATP-dependent DNA helicase PcrA
MNFNSVIATAWEKYEATKSEYNSIDFDDILIIFKEMLKSIPEFRNTIKDSFTNIIVDEFQDSSSQQIEIINLIKKNNLTVVGDDAQTIYSWRNADVNLIKNFKKTNCPQFTTEFRAISIN